MMGGDLPLLTYSLFVTLAHCLPPLVYGARGETNSDGAQPDRTNRFQPDYTPSNRLPCRLAGAEGMMRPLPETGRRGLCLVVAAPSGAGKSSITRALLAEDPGLRLSVSVTTRAPRAGEQEGVHYYFRTQEEFDAMAAEGQLLEYARVFGRSYGTPRGPVQKALSEGSDVLFDVDWQGYHQLRSALPGDVVGIFVLPPSLDDLASRLQGRGDAPDIIAQRMAAARDEIAHVGEFPYVVVNTHLPEAIDQVRTILHAARTETKRQGWLRHWLGGLGLSE
ncbi:Guanylate kinase [Granulibacter bethesdensis]|uniref:Guanylate kinase n=2 Tax=Granulibacter bethesdensis TaxID=364410 RepID=A0AAC9K8A5_9PROT|nr:Guanylate kinase [Granulibacter bethesdensis]APH63118.1 Guanylate kinase [Granulibacter bethesdensis]